MALKFGLIQSLLLVCSFGIFKCPLGILISRLLYNKSALLLRELGVRGQELRSALATPEPDSSEGSTALDNALVGVPVSNGRLPVDLDGPVGCLRACDTLLLRLESGPGWQYDCQLFNGWR